MHLYLHVPFCARRCSYCDFAIAVRRHAPSAEYARLVLEEWRRRLGDRRVGEVAGLDTLYLGGGTPSRLDPDDLDRLIAGLTGARPLRPGAEVTLEANPEDVTPERAAAWRRSGVNRVSLGVQSFDPQVLAWMHRTHRAEQVPEAVGRLRQAGITNLSLDLIYGLPPELGREWRRDLDAALALAPDHLSLYALTVEAATPLGRWVERGSTEGPPEALQAGEFLAADERLTAAGFIHYEVSNYGRPGREAVHNRAYWTRRPYLGLGPSAHSAVGGRRWWNLREWEAWRRAAAEGRSTVAGEEELSPEAMRLEDLYLGLRTREGVAGGMVPSTVREAWVTAGWASLEAGRLRLSPKGWLRLDALVAQAVPD